MKNRIAVLLFGSVLISILLSLFCVWNMSVDADVSSLNPPNTKLTDVSTALGGYQNVNLTYTFRYYAEDKGRLTEEHFMPYVAYLDKQGNIKDYFFDSYLFLPCADCGPSGASMHADLGNPTKAIDWTSYVEDTFASDKNVNALDFAFGQTKKALGDTDTKAGVFFTILYPSATSTDFGYLGGKKLDFSKTEDRKHAIKWIIDEQIKLYERSNYENLDLVGFYWLEEYIVEESDVELFQYASEYLHSLGLKFIWIPWYMATGYDRQQELGIDVACMQPNLFWLGYTDPNRVSNSIEISKQYGMGMEIEVDYNVMSDYYFNRYLYYLEGGMKSGMMNSVKMYYQNASPGVYYTACYTNYGNFRAVYDLTYKYAKGTLTQSDIDDCRPQGVDDDFVEDINFDGILKNADWISVGKSYTGCPSYFDGNGADYQDISGQELTDGVIASEDLSTDWFAFHNSIRDQEGRMSITVDLGEVRDDIKHFAAHFDNKQLYAIGAPVDICIYTSIDGKNFNFYSSPILKLDPSYSAFYINGDAVTARYIKLSIGGTDKPYVFCSEFLVGIDKSDMLGDVNGNEKIDVMDYIQLKRVYFGTFAFDEEQLKRADLTENGEIDTMDYINLKRAYFGTYIVQ